MKLRIDRWIVWTYPRISRITSSVQSKLTVANDSLHLYFQLSLRLSSRLSENSVKATVKAVVYRVLEPF